MKNRQTEKENQEKNEEKDKIGKNLQEKLIINQMFIELLENFTRVKIFVLLLVYGQLSLTEIAEKAGVTKQAISLQIRKFVELGILQITKQQVRGSIKANLYELAPNFTQNAVIKIDYQSDYPHQDTKEISIQEMRAQKLLYSALKIFFESTSALYSSYEEKFRQSESPFPVKPPLFDFSAVPITKSEYITVRQRLTSIIGDLYNEINEKRKNNTEWEERPYLLISSFLPIKEIVENRDLD